MTLDEAILHCEEVAEEKEKDFRLCPYPSQECNGSQNCRCLKNGSGKGCLKYAAEHRQLASWLRELKELRIENKALKNRCIDFEHGAPCRYCPLDCEFRKYEKVRSGD